MAGNDTTFGDILGAPVRNNNQEVSASTANTAPKSASASILVGVLSGPELSIEGNRGDIDAQVSTGANSSEADESLKPKGEENRELPKATHLKNRHFKGKKRLFALAKEKERTANFVNPEDYEQRYPPDEFGQEMGPNARVWRVYLDEADLNDRDMVEGWKDGVDVLLVFAGLFSAVVTTFVTQTSQKLDQDFGQISASLLTELIAVQRAIATGSSLEEIPTSTLTLSSPAQFTIGDAWVNGLWFVSLTLSLVTALSAVLIKQWIQHYVSFVSGTPQERARIHQFRYVGLERWGVHIIIGVLPVLLYVALFLFIFGLAIFLQALKPEIAKVVEAIGGTIFLLYVVTNALPLFFPQCPYRTPLIEHVYKVLHPLAFALRRLVTPLIIYITSEFRSRHWLAMLHLSSERVLSTEERISIITKAQPFKDKLSTLRAFEFVAAAENQDKIVCEVVRWLFTVSSNPSVKPIALQALSGLGTNTTVMMDLFAENSEVDRELAHEFRRQRMEANRFSDDPTTLINTPQFYTAERILRTSMLTSRRYWEYANSVWKPPSWEIFDDATHQFDASPAFQLYLATYRLQSILNRMSLNDLVQTLTSLSILATMADQCPFAWQTWANGLRIMPRTWWLQEEGFSILVLHESLPSFYLELLSPGSNVATWQALLPLVCTILPQSIVKKYYDTSIPQWYDYTKDKTLHAAKLRLRSMLLSCVISEWDKNRDGSAFLERVVAEACNLQGEEASHFLHGIYTSVQPLFCGVLASLVGHEMFIRSDWQAVTYQHLFIAYIGAIRRQSSPAVPDAFLAPEHFHSIMEKANVVHGLLAALFSFFTYDGGQHLPNIVAQITRASEEVQGLSAPVIGNVFDAFIDLCSKRGLIQENENVPAPAPLWPSHMQPLVRWMIAHVTSHNVVIDPHPSINTFMNDLIEKPAFLSYTCSPFLVDGNRRVVISKESSILLELALRHKNKPGAADVWREFLSQTRDVLAALHDTAQPHIHWSQAEFDQYALVADMLDQLASILELDSSKMKAPRFESRYIAECLMARQWPPVQQQSPAITNRSIFKFSKLGFLIPCRTQADSASEGGV